MMGKYFYDGPVMEFGHLVENNWKGGTVAQSEKKALNNLSYQWKKKNNRLMNTRIVLPGKLCEIS